MVARRSATGRRPVAGTIWFWLLQVKPFCDQIDRRKVLVVADRLLTSRRLIVDQLQRLQTVPTHFLVTDWSPIGCRPISKMLQTVCNKKKKKKTPKIQSPTSRRPIANRLPIAPRLIADWSATTVRLHDSIL